MEPFEESPQQENNPLTPLALMHLKDTVPWVRFFGISGIVIAAIYFLVGLVSAIKTPVMGIIFILISAFYFFVCNLLNQYGRYIKRFLQSKEPVQLEIALRKQQTFGMISGIITIIMIICMALFMIFAGGTFLHLMNQSKGIEM